MGELESFTMLHVLDHNVIFELRWLLKINLKQIVVVIVVVVVVVVKISEGFLEGPLRNLDHC
jgi:hypothetical protein